MFFMNYQSTPHKLFIIGVVISTAISIVPFSPVMAQSFGGPVPVDIQTGLVSHWRFDENNGNTAYEHTIVLETHQEH